MKDKSKAVDITSFDAVSESEAGFNLPMKGTDGADIGFKLVIIGRHSNAVQTFSKKIFQRMQREESMAKKRGKDPEPMDIEELKQQSIDGALVRVVGWVDVDQEFSKDLLKAALLRNPHWVDQIIEASNNDANFSKAS